MLEFVLGCFLFKMKKIYKSIDTGRIRIRMAKNQRIRPDPDPRPCNGGIKILPRPEDVTTPSIFFACEPIQCLLCNFSLYFFAN